MSHVLGGEYVGLEEIDNGLWDVCFGPLKLGRLDENDYVIRGQDPAHSKVLPMFWSVLFCYLRSRLLSLAGPHPP